MSFLAVLSALAAPVSLLAQDVGSGKLGGLCYAAPVLDGQLQGEPELSQFGGHCRLCITSGLALLPLAVFTPAPLISYELALRMAPSDRAVIVSGLPFSRGPPVLN
ncbi:MAG: hypothetical protein Q7U05_08960 [Polaromonas sp.]|nr:hypothetical protein [Polaromonas sp.]